MLHRKRPGRRTLAQRSVDTSLPSPILGWSLDGFPIYGSYGCADADCTEVIELHSSWQNTSIQDGTQGCESSRVCDQGSCDDGDCFVCGPVMENGLVITACASKDYAWDTNEYQAQNGEQYLDECNGRTQPDGTYGYHVTATFPYTLGCYRGTPTGVLGGGMGGGMDPGMDPPGMGGPPQEAQDACAGLAEGDACSFEGRMGMQINGACRNIQGTLACAPAGGPPGGGP